MNAPQQYQQWLTKAPAGLVLVGAGLCMVTAAGFAKYAGRPWFWRGTAALTVFNAGLSIFGDAVKHRMHYERLREAAAE